MEDELKRGSAGKAGRLGTGDFSGAEQKPCFIDVEASSLDVICSYPVEVAICLPGEVIHSWLLKPAPLWRDWSEESAKIHGIARDQLHQEGANIVEVAHALNELIPGEAICDALPYDSFWIYRLFRAAKISPAFEVEPLAALLTSAQLAGWPEAKCQVVSDSGIEPHRAGNDALILHKTWMRISHR